MGTGNNRGWEQGTTEAGKRIIDAEKMMWILAGRQKYRLGKLAEVRPLGIKKGPVLHQNIRRFDLRPTFLKLPQKRSQAPIHNVLWAPPVVFAFAPYTVSRIFSVCATLPRPVSSPRLSATWSFLYLLPHWSGLTRLMVFPMHFCHSQAI